MRKAETDYHPCGLIPCVCEDDHPRKEFCVVCGVRLPTEPKHYLIYGNYCFSCSGDATMKSREPKAILYDEDSPTGRPF